MSEIKKIVLASGNAGKVREINKLFAGSGIEVIPQHLPASDPFRIFIIDG